MMAMNMMLVIIIVVKMLRSSTIDNFTSAAFLSISQTFWFPAQDELDFNAGA